MVKMMKNFEEKDMYLYDSEKSVETFGDFITNISPDFDGFVFYKIRRDGIGKSGR